MKTATDNLQGHVYLIHAIGTSRYKIGMTQAGRMVSRFDELNSKQSAYPLEILGVIDVEDRFSVEKELHQKYKDNRKHGEWFELNKGELREVEATMGSYGKDKNKELPMEPWRLFCLVAGTIILLFAWQSYQGDRSQVSPQLSIPSVPSP